MTKTIFNYLEVGSKVFLVLLVPNLILLVPKLFAMSINPLLYLALIPIFWILSGYFITKWRNFIFR